MDSIIPSDENLNWEKKKSRRGESHLNNFIPFFLLPDESRCEQVPITTAVR